jgi:hypothetical protein
MSRRRIILWVLIGCAGLLMLPCGFFGLWFALEAGSSNGSPELAAEWRAALLAAPGPDEAAAADPDVVVLRFPNGEWAFGKSQDSHGTWRRGGGTLVVRDSRSRVRAFFGHVCGPHYMQWGFGRDHPSLDAFYDRVVESGYVEYTFPDAAEPASAEFVVLLSPPTHHLQGHEKYPGVAPDRRPAR